MADSPLETPEPDALARVRRTRVAVIGGGIGGLVAALEWARIGAQVTVIERRDRLGGGIETVELDGMAVDAVADTLPLDDALLAALLDERGLRDAVEPAAPHPVWLSGIPGSTAAAPLPADTIVGIPANPWADDVRRVIGWRGAWRAYLDRLRPPLTIGHERSLGRLVRTRMGARVVDRLVAPVTRGLHGAHPDDIDVDLAAPGLSAALTRVGSLSGAVAALLPEGTERPAVRSSGTRTTLRGGLGRLVDALAQRLTELDAELVTDVAVTALTRADDEWRVQAASDEPGEAARTVTAADVIVVATDGAAATALLASAGVSIPTGDLPLPAARTREVVTLVVDAPTLDAAPRGRAVYPIIQASARDTAAAAASMLVQATADWRWLAAAAGPGRHVLRVTLDGAPPASEEEAVAAATQAAATLLGVHLRGPRAAVVRRVAAAPPASLIGFAEYAKRVRASVAATSGIAIVGAWVAGSGIGQIVADATVEVDRQRHAILWEDPSGASRKNV